MKPFYRLFLFGLLLLCGSSAHAQVIQSFHAEIHANKDTSLDVLETVVMDFQNAQRHGIYRTIPVDYDRDGGRYTIYLEMLSITDEYRFAYSYSSSREGQNLKFQIGDPRYTITGLHTYNIHYRVRRAVNFFKGAPEFYWNATGDEWLFPMNSASARFYPPPGTSISSVKTASFVGPPGARIPANITLEPNSILFYTSKLPAGEGLTIVAWLPAGSVVPPPAFQTVLWFFADWWPLFVFPLLTAVVMLGLWMANGRDIEGGLPAQVEWAPPKDLSPAEVGTLVDESCDMTDIISTLIDLAARGYLTIEEVASEKILFFQAKDYAFVRSMASKVDDVLLPHERTFLTGVFGSGASSGQTVMLSSLKNQFYINLPTIRDSIYDSLTQKRLFTSNPESTRSRYQGIGVLLALAGFFSLTILGSMGLFAYGIGITISGVIIFVGAKAMPAKTALGSRKLRECQGFQRFVQLAERGRIEKLITDDPTIFGRLLPYAMVLGVGDEWATKFSGLMTQPPDWYVGSNYNTFNSTIFVNNLGSSMNSMGKTFESKPAQSTGGSGGSGFSGGGGGGFGGGGGGSW